MPKKPKTKKRDRNIVKIDSPDDQDAHTLAEKERETLVACDSPDDEPEELS